MENKKGTGEDRIWEKWRRREQGRTTKFEIYGEEENRGEQQNLGYMGKKNRAGQNMGDMEKKGTGEDRIWEMRREQGRTEYGR
jgi:hypothetical protein